MIFQQTIERTETMIRYLRKRSISVFLVLCFLIISISTPTTEAISSIVSNETSVTVNEHMISVEETVPIVIDSLNKNECMIGEYVNSQDFNAAEHIKRLPDEEELDTYVFLNENGSKSVYYMDENVKYIDAAGAIKEKDISLVAKSDGYGIARNEFDLHIPTVATSGIEMSHEGYTVKIIPQSTVKNVSAQEVNDSIVYDGFFGTNTKLKYTPMLSGIKEDVILETYIPNASFRFVLETDGLTLYNDGNDYWLAEDETSEAILHLGKIIIYDAVGKPEYGTMAVTTVTVGRKYVLSLSAPESYLTDPTTIYPVTIDPTLTVSDTVTGEGAIEDTTLFSNRTSKNYGDYKYLSIGYVDSTYGAGRVAVKLPGLYNSNNYLNASASDITSVKFYCWDTSGNSAQMVNIYRITSAAWNENEVTYGDSVSYSTATNWGKSMSNAVWTAFDITTLVRGWKTGSYSAAKGFIMINPNETSASYKKAPYSSEYSNSSYRPYVVMTFTPNFQLSYVHYYDSTFVGNTAAIQNITYANTFSNFVYSRYFNVSMTMDGSASQYDTIADDCTLGVNEDCSSVCGTNCGSSHHKNRYRISTQLYNEPRESNHLYVLWTNRDSGTYCNSTDGNHSTSSALAVVYNKRPVIHFLRVYDALNVQRACMALNLVHETAHTLKMSDVYNNAGHDTNGETNCVMERFESSNAYAYYQDVLNGIKRPFCSSCEESMLSYTSNISIPGN